MCVAFCHKRHILFFTHDDCPPLQCRWTDPTLHGSCDDCDHNRNGRCALTNVPLPIPEGGCCHWNTPLATGPQTISLAQMRLLPPFAANQPASDVLASYGIPATPTPNGPLIDPDNLILPLVYGRGTDITDFEEDDLDGLTDPGNETAVFW